jgi:hypothetical protein
MDVIDAFYLLHHTPEKVVTEKLNMTKPMKNKLVAVRDKRETNNSNGRVLFLGCTSMSSPMFQKNILPRF